MSEQTQETGSMPTFEQRVDSVTKIDANEYVTKGEIVDFLQERISLFSQFIEMQRQLGSPYLNQLYLEIANIQQHQIDCLSSFNRVELQRILALAPTNQEITLMNRQREAVVAETQLVHAYIGNGQELQAYLAELPSGNTSQQSRAVEGLDIDQIQQQIKDKRAQIDELLHLAANSKTGLRRQFLIDISQKRPIRQNNRHGAQQKPATSLSPEILDKYVRTHTKLCQATKGPEQPSVSQDKQKEILQRNMQNIQKIGDARRQKVEEQELQAQKAQKAEENRKKAMAQRYQQLSGSTVKQDGPHNGRVSPDTKPQ